MDSVVQKAYDWFKERGGNAAFATTSNGGRFWLARGEISPFAPLTIKRLVDGGHAKYLRDDEGRINRLQLL